MTLLTGWLIGLSDPDLIVLEIFGRFLATMYSKKLKQFRTRVL